jgi:hypothetical protein
LLLLTVIAQESKDRSDQYCVVQIKLSDAVLKAIVTPTLPVT